MKPDTLRTSFWRACKGRKGVFIIALLAVTLMTLSAKQVAVLGVDAYQTWISPHKGYHCAFAEHHHGTSCSAYGKKVFQEHGVAAGLLMLKVRFEQCHDARLALESASRRIPKCEQASGCGDCGEGTGKGCGIFGGHFCQGFCDGCGK